MKFYKSHVRKTRRKKKKALARAICLLTFRDGARSSWTSAWARLMTADSKKPLFLSANKPFDLFLLLLPIGWVGCSGVKVIVREKASELLLFATTVLNVGNAPGMTEFDLDWEFGGGCG